MNDNTTAILVKMSDNKTHKLIGQFYAKCATTVVNSVTRKTYMNFRGVTMSSEILENPFLIVQYSKEDRFLQIELDHTSPKIDLTSEK